MNFMKSLFGKQTSSSGCCGIEIKEVEKMQEKSSQNVSTCCSFSEEEESSCC
ncbi:hypothetical protein [Cytobacillus sp. NCCP-133]|uniref:hypothetical protein n=1 Tax=Cytobacillus sp. NCCP-133 TaxID=766848 RepID=UPI00223200A9|nr:hypothetical protein [Cytobacillus sp. NCCP-133]GLB59623.1 hypothetical protein NCCP133_17560 [Cytobacillus sp. NCCP-133]